MKITLITNSANGQTSRDYNLSVPGAAEEVLNALAKNSDDFYASTRLTNDMSCSVPAESIQEWAGVVDAGNGPQFTRNITAHELAERL